MESSIDGIYTKNKRDSITLKKAITGARDAAEMNDCLMHTPARKRWEVRQEGSAVGSRGAGSLMVKRGKGKSTGP